VGFQRLSLYFAAVFLPPLGKTLQASCETTSVPVRLGVLKANRNAYFFHFFFMVSYG
jgi:hypothetical protein